MTFFYEQKDMRNFIVVVFLLVIFSISSYGTETWQEAAEVVRKPCAEFVQTQSKPEVMKKWRKKLEERIEQRIVDQAGDYEQHLRAIVLDWAAGNEGLLRAGDKEAYIELCLYIGIFIEKGMSPPNMMRDRLTVDVARQLVERLRGF